MARYIKTERLGVNAVERIVIDSLNWIFREESTVDVGIDAQMERVDDGLPSGKLIALQIKTGASHFKEQGDYLIYYAKDVHIQYWCGHSLPVLLIAHLPETNKTYWAHIGESSIESTSSAWRIVISKSNVFDVGTKDKISALFENRIDRQKHYYLSNVQWTPYLKIDISGFVPPTASHIQAQYRIWSDQDAVPLLIRVASEDGSGIMQEHSGPSGIINLMLTSTEHIYISLSHPSLSFQLQALGWIDNI